MVEDLLEVRLSLLELHASFTPMRVLVHGLLKRSVDVLVAALLIVLLAPLLLVVAILVRLRLGSPTLFRQQRPGLHEETFTILKFRTMTDARDRSGTLLPDDQRLTGLGRRLRSMSLDELPELVNVLRGDMSMVGPRPLLMEYLPLYSPEQRRRHEMRPGITGWTQVNGRNALTWDEKLRLDVWYVDHRSVWLDLRILVRTLAVVVKGKGVSQPGVATAERFRGPSTATSSTPHKPEST